MSLFSSVFFPTKENIYIYVCCFFSHLTVYPADFSIPVHREPFCSFLQLNGIALCEYVIITYLVRGPYQWRLGYLQPFTITYRVGMITVQTRPLIHMYLYAFFLGLLSKSSS